jgi:hypothetical protein
MPGFWNNFQDHRRLSESRKNRPKKLLEGFSKSVSDFTEASRNNILLFLHKKKPKTLKTASAHSKSKLDF